MRIANGAPGTFHSPCRLAVSRSLHASSRIALSLLQPMSTSRQPSRIPQVPLGSRHLLHPLPRELERFPMDARLASEYAESLPLLVLCHS